MRNSILIAAACAAAFTASARATLQSFDSGGVGLVYSSETNVTYPSDANLLATMINARGFDAVVADILAAAPMVPKANDFLGTTQVAVTAADFQSEQTRYLGKATYYGAEAFIVYLNSIDYGGSNHWRLPDAINSVYANPYPSGYVKSGDLPQLYYDELHFPSSFPDFSTQSDFTNLQSDWYWSEDHSLINDGYPGYLLTYGFEMGRGDQYNLDPSFEYYVLPDITGLVPEPATAMLLLPASVAAAASRRRIKPQRTDRSD